MQIVGWPASTGTVGPPATQQTLCLLFFNIPKPLDLKHKFSFKI